jgi:hypothetical protein
MTQLCSMKIVLSIVLTIVLVSACLRQDSSPTATTSKEVDWSKIEVKSTTLSTVASTTSYTTTTIYLEPLAKNLSPTSSTSQLNIGCCYPVDCPQSSNNPEKCACYYMVYCSTTTSIKAVATTSTTIKHQLKEVMPAPIPYDKSWLICNHTWDCMTVRDCCGVGLYGRKYSINSQHENDWDHLLKDFCQSKDHRKGCGWVTPDYSSATCIDGLCRFEYTNSYSDNLTDSPAYNWSFVIIPDSRNYTAIAQWVSNFTSVSLENDTGYTQYLEDGDNNS